MDKYMVKLAVLKGLVHIKQHGPFDKEWALCSNTAQVAGGGLFCSSATSREVGAVLQELGAAWYKQRTGQHLLWYNRGYFINGHTTWKVELCFRRFWSNPLRLDFLHFAIDALTEELDFPV